MDDESKHAEAIEAVKALRQATKAGHRFPADELWSYSPGGAPASTQRQGLIKFLVRNGYIAKTGRTTKASTSSRKASSGIEYTFGPEICAKSAAICYLNLPENPHGQPKPHDELQRLVHGCPGSGKSYLLEQESKSAHFSIRTVFHPETRYTDFVGGLRPVSVYKVPDDDPPKFIGSDFAVVGEPYVIYVVQPGPLLKAYHLACLHPNKSVVLIIEELSRAVAAHVFGDMLQLLDRLEEEKNGLPPGASEYEIDPRPEIRDWLLSQDIAHHHVTPGQVRFPPNLYIWATMNRSDQNARQLDSAFLRRWSKQYLSYLLEGAYDSAEVRYGGAMVSWETLRKAINERLKALEGIPEDKFIGPYFLRQSKLQDPSVVGEDLWGHLWNDVLKTRAPHFFAGAATFAELLEIWDAGEGMPIGHLPTLGLAAD